ncbi:zinc finger protein 391-like isoform X2 [Lutzomyia longipalpis]|uniref:zinc finger protein 391-like isoform X2 n=1 Tax=Lutzomyia longipalpis TaxID=7200 RepID=UPI0024833D1D|nr:zinc finger protein 391-like isoform X2 [Lutzomyia longipalpis]
MGEIFIGLPINQANVKRKFFTWLRHPFRDDPIINLTAKESIHLKEKLHKIGDFKVKYDQWLKFICIPCSLQLQNAFEFKKQSEETYAKLIVFLNIWENTENTNSNHSLNEEHEDDQYSQNGCYDAPNSPNLNIVNEEPPVQQEGNESEEDTKYSDLFDFDKICNELLEEDFEENPKDFYGNEEDHSPESSLPEEDREKTYFDLFEVVEDSQEIANETASPKKIELLPELVRFLRKQNKIPTLDGKWKKWEKPPPRKPGRKPQGKKIYECELCSKTFLQKHNMKDHIVSNHLNKRAYTCDLCGKEFKYNGEFYKHRKYHTMEPGSQGELPRIPCNICGKSMKNPLTLYCHMKTHQRSQNERERPFLCHYCGYASPTMAYLREHLQTHLDAKPHKCKECGKSFNLKAAWLSHMNIHSGKRPHGCHLCPKTFYNRTHLRQHIHTHTGERDHHCKVCGKGFRFPFNVREHMRVHTGEKPHSCPVCHKKFAQEKTMKKHLVGCSSTEHSTNQYGADEEVQQNRNSEIASTEGLSYE